MGTCFSTGWTDYAELSGLLEQFIAVHGPGYVVGQGAEPHLLFLYRVLMGQVQGHLLHSIDMPTEALGKCADPICDSLARPGKHVSPQGGQRLATQKVHVGVLNHLA